MNIEVYQRNILPPLQVLLYRDASVLVMRYAELGTLVDVLKVLVTATASGNSGRRSLDRKEHEYLVAYISCQVLKFTAAGYFLFLISTFVPSAFTNNCISA